MIGFMGIVRELSLQRNLLVIRPNEVKMQKQTAAAQDSAAPSASEVTV